MKNLVLPFIYFKYSLLIPLFFTISCWAQLKMSEIQTVDFNIINIDTMYCGTEIYFYEKNNGFKDIKSGYLYGMQTSNNINGIVFNSNNLTLGTDESPLFLKDKLLITKQICWTDYDTELNSYRIIGNQLIHLKSLKISGIENYIKVDKNTGLIAVSNFSESYGTYIKIYNTDLEILYDYKPFLTGYEQIEFSVSEGRLAVIARETLDLKLSKVIMIDLISKEVIFDKIFNYKLESIYLKIFNSQLLISGYDGQENFLLLLDNGGNEVWKKYKKISHYVTKPIFRNGVMYATSKDNVFSINLSTGEDIWNYSNQDDDNIILALSFLSDSSNNIGVIVGKKVIPKRGSNKKGYFNDIYLIELNHLGDTITNFKIEDKVEKLNIQYIANKLYLITDHKTRTYEKF